MKFRWNDNLGYWLFYSQRTVAYAFSEVLRQCCREHEKPYTITPPQWGLLAQLFERDGIAIGTISQKVGLDAPTITGIVKRMEQSGLVERRHDGEDQRVVTVYLTREGQAIMPALFEAVTRFHGILTAGLTETELHELQTNLQRIIRNLSLVAPGTGDRFGLLPENLAYD